MYSYKVVGFELHCFFLHVVTSTFLMDLEESSRKVRVYSMLCLDPVYYSHHVLYKLVFPSLQRGYSDCGLELLSTSPEASS